VFILVDYYFKRFLLKTLECIRKKKSLSEKEAQTQLQCISWEMNITPGRKTLSLMKTRGRH